MNEYLIVSVIVNVSLAAALVLYIMTKNSGVRTVIGYYPTMTELDMANNEIVNKLYARKDIKVVSVKAVHSIEYRLVVKYIPLDEDAVVEVPRFDS